MLVGHHQIASPSGHIPYRSVSYLGDVSGHGSEGRRQVGVGLHKGFHFGQSNTCSKCHRCVYTLLKNKVELIFVLCYFDQLLFLPQSSGAQTHGTS